MMTSIHMKKALSITLALFMSASMLTPMVSNSRITAKAANEKSIASLGTAAIKNPEEGNGNWDYVYYGNYSGNRVKYRVLSSNTTDFSNGKTKDETLLLDCDNVLYELPTQSSKVSMNNQNDDLMHNLNGNSFLNSESFSAAERDAIYASTKHRASDFDGRKDDGNFSALKGDKIFALDPKEATNKKYGYSDTPTDNKRKKISIISNSSEEWWLRLQLKSDKKILGNFASDKGFVVNKLSGRIDQDKLTKTSGVSPAFNVSLSKILFSSLVPGTTKEYKLTLIDDSMLMPRYIEGTKSGNNIDLSFEYPAVNIDSSISFSVLLLKDKYKKGLSKTSDYAYIPLKNVTILTEQGEPTPSYTKVTGKFAIPAGCEGYNAYLISEVIGGAKETDYACSPVRFDLDKKDHKHAWKITDSKGDRITTAADKVAMISCSECHNVKYTVSLDATTKVYDGKPPKVEVKKSEGFPSDIKVSPVIYKLHNDSKSITEAQASNVGEYDAVIGITAGEETSELKDDYKIEPRTITPDMITLSEKEYVYDGTAKTPAVTVKLGDIVLVENTDYTIEYKDNINPGIANVIVTAKSSNYSGKGIKDFKIDNPDTNLKRDADDLVNKVKDKHNKNDKETTNAAKVDSPQVEIPAPKHQVGDKIIDAGNTYIITSTDELDLTVTFAEPATDTAKNVDIPLSIFDNNIEYRVTEISDNAFKGNKNLKKVTIGENVNKIGANAFYKCKNLKSIKILTKDLSKKNVGKNAFKKINKTAKIKVPKSKFKAYKKLLKSKGVNGKEQKITK
ncbi:leucine-rich repeat protein [Butyrivibrio sp. LC3010]|uniref:leucine-rich repeat protein n=1 Tax=Butyrivibrio sp. LC3010 TaxID=1280680 RepID=UPI0003F55784|nr:leucine-rich repeat protein [Butyrivibrio sp. LC3010]